MTRKQLVYQLLMCQVDLLCAQIDELQRRVRYRRIMSTDCVELLIAIEKLEMLKELQRNIFTILQIDEIEFEEKMKNKKAQ